MSGEVPDVITPIKFDVDRFRGFWSKIAVFYWQGESPLQQFCTTVQTVMTQPTVSKHWRKIAS